MSNSYKKNPFYKEKYGKDRKWAKRMAQKAVRRYNGKIPNGTCYKNLICRWDINDYTFFEPWNVDSVKYWKNKSEWKKFYYRK